MAAEPMSHQHATPPMGQGRYTVAIEAYVRLSFGDEIELFGIIGDETFTAESFIGRRAIKVNGHVGGEQADLRFGRLKLRGMPVTGQVMGQSVEGIVTGRDGTVIFNGVAGREALRYELDPGGRTSSFGQPLGVRIVYQAFYSELVGGVDRMADATMIGLLLPVFVHRRERQLGQ